LSEGLQKITDEQLISGCLKGKLDLQKELFNRYSGKMLGVCRRYSRNYDDSKDILQDAFIKIFKNLSEFRNEGSLEGWIRKIVVHTALNYYRKSSFKNEKTGLDKQQASAEIEPAAFESLNAQDIIAAISTLPDGYRMVFNLYAIEGYSHKEIAEMLDIDESTSRSQLFKARNTLKVILLKTQNILV
jgi:RNA polymerase sigma factor (sigma-70 family)